MAKEPVDNPLDRLPDVLKRNLERNLCVCNEVPKALVIDAIAEGASTLEEVQKKTFASDGNECCKRQVLRLIECIHEVDMGIGKPGQRLRRK